MEQRAVFLDRDGVINVNRQAYVKSWEEFRFLSGVFEPLRRLARTDFSIVVVSNQSAIGRGLVRRTTVEEINQRMVAEISAEGGRIDAVYYCPHRPEDGCDCRKPRPGMLLRAALDLSIDLSASYFIGDAVSDVEAGFAAGCRPILVLTGRGDSQHVLLAQGKSETVAVVRDLADAVAMLLDSAREG